MKQITNWPKSIVLESGTSDDVTAFRFDGGYYFVSTNRALGYIGIDVYEQTDFRPGEPWLHNRGIFWQNDWDVEAVFGKKAFKYTPRHLLKIALATYGEEL